MTDYVGQELSEPSDLAAAVLSLPDNVPLLDKLGAMVGRRGELTAGWPRIQRLSTHPDLVSRLGEGAEGLAARRFALGGYPFLVHPNARAFAVAVGTLGIWLRLPAGAADPSWLIAAPDPLFSFPGWLQVDPWAHVQHTDTREKAAQLRAESLTRFRAAVHMACDEAAFPA